MFSSGQENGIHKNQKQDFQKLNTEADTSPTQYSCFACLSFYNKKKKTNFQKSQFDDLAIRDPSISALNEGGGQIEKSPSDNIYSEHYEVSKELLKPMILNKIPTNDKKQQKSSKLKDLPKNKLFILKSKASLTSIVAKITEKKLSSNIIPQKSNVQEQFDPVLNCLRQTTPQNIAQYIATRVSGQNLIVDLGCGVGGNTIQFAKTCDFVVSIDIDEQSLKQAQSTTLQYNLEGKVEFIFANLLNLRKLRADTVFVNPTINNNFLVIDLFRDCQPNIFQIMDRALHIAPNIIMQFPKNIDITQLPAIFNLQRFPHLHFANNVIEIEILSLNENIEYYIIYFGQVAKITDQEYNSFIVRELQKRGLFFNGQDMSEKMECIIKVIKDKVGNFKIFELIIQTIEQCPKNLPLFQYFLSNAYFKHYISQEQMIQFTSMQTINKSQNASETFDISAQSLNVDQSIHTPLTNSEQQNKFKQIYSSSIDLQIISPTDFSFKIDNVIKGCGNSMNKIYGDLKFQNKDQSISFNFQSNHANQEIEEVKSNYV